MYRFTLKFDLWSSSFDLQRFPTEGTSCFTNIIHNIADLLHLHMHRHQHDLLLPGERERDSLHFPWSLAVSDRWDIMRNGEISANWSPHSPYSLAAAPCSTCILQHPTVSYSIPLSDDLLLCPCLAVHSSRGTRAALRVHERDGPTTIALRIDGQQVR